jgi:hypothetical protein
MRYPYITYITYITGFGLCQNIPVTHFTAELLGGSSHESCNDPWVRKFPVSHPDYWLLADLLTRSNHLRPVKWTNIWCLIICESYVNHISPQFPIFSYIFHYFPPIKPATCFTWTMVFQCQGIPRLLSRFPRGRCCAAAERAAGALDPRAGRLAGAFPEMDFAPWKHMGMGQK